MLVQSGRASPAHDGKTVITFSEATGDRDKVWTEIAQAIEKRARKS